MMGYYPDLQIPFVERLRAVLHEFGFSAVRVSTKVHQDFPAGGQVFAEVLYITPQTDDICTVGINVQVVHPSEAEAKRIATVAAALITADSFIEAPGSPIDGVSRAETTGPIKNENWRGSTQCSYFFTASLTQAALDTPTTIQGI